MGIKKAQQFPDNDQWYVVEQALWSARDEAFLHRFWAYGMNLDDARGILREIPAGRIIHCRLIEIKEQKS